MDISRYIPEGYQPNSASIKDLYYEAQTELVAPTPAVQFRHFETLNLITGGLRPKEFTLLCGSTGTGKTTLIANWSVDMLEQGIPHFVASVETGYCDYVRRMISAIAGKDWNTGDPVPIDALKIFNAQHGQKFRADNFWLSLYDDRFTVETLMADIAFHVKHHGVKVAIIDNLNFFLEVTRASDQIVEMDRVIHELIIFCKQVPVHVVMIVHPKKTESARVESEFDCKGSSTAVQESHNVLLFNRPHPDLIEAGVATEYDRELMIAKMRRRGRYVRRRLILKSEYGVRYTEGNLV